MTFRQRLKARELLVGTLISLASPEVTEIMASAGFDWLFLDAEHSPLEHAGFAAIGAGRGMQRRASCAWRPAPKCRSRKRWILARRASSRRW